MDWKTLTDDNFIMYAMKNYDNPQCRDMAEFEDDLNRIVYIKKLLRKYVTDGDLKERLIINHLITFYNVFGKSATHMLFFKLEKELYPTLKTFLIYLNFLSHDEPSCKYSVDMNVIMIDSKIVSKLRKL